MPRPLLTGGGRPAGRAGLQSLLFRRLGGVSDGLPMPPFTGRQEGKRQKSAPCAARPRRFPLGVQAVSSPVRPAPFPAVGVFRAGPVPRTETAPKAAARMF